MAAQLVEPRRLGPAQRQDERGHLGQLARDELEQEDRALVGGLEVVEDEQERLVRSRLAQGFGDGLEEPKAVACGRAAADSSNPASRMVILPPVARSAM